VSNNNLYDILKNFASLTPKAEAPKPVAEKIYESVNPRGSVSEGIANIESRLAKQFAESDFSKMSAGIQKSGKSKASADAITAAVGREKLGQREMTRRAVAGKKHAHEDMAEAGQRRGMHGEPEFVGIPGPAKGTKPSPKAITKGADREYYKVPGFHGEPERTRWRKKVATPTDECTGCAMGECSVHGGIMENDDNDLKILDACAAIYRVQYNGGDEIWDKDWMQDWAHALRQANPTDKELDFIIANGQMPKRLANVELDVGDDFQFSEGEITRKPGVTTHTKTDYPGYPTDDLEKDDDDRTGPKSIGGRGRPRKAQTKNPRRDPNALKKGRGRPASVKSSPVSMPTDPFGRVTGRVPAGKKGTVHSKMDESIKRLVTESVNFKRMMEEQHMTLDEMLECMNQDMKQFKESGVCSDRLRDMLEVFAHAKKQMEETIDPTNPRDYEIPTVQRQAQGQAPLTMKDVQDKEQKAAIDYQRRVGNVQQDPMEEELNELARLAGLGEVSRGEYIKQQDTAAEKSGKNEFNAFGQLFNTDEVNEDDIEEGPEIFKLKADAAKKAGEKEFKGPDGKMYPVQEDKVEVDNTDESEEDHANKPNPKYGTVKNIIDQGDDLNRKKKQDPHTANRAANPLTNSPTLEAKLMAEYESIKKSK